MCVYDRGEKSLTLPNLIKFLQTFPVRMEERGSGIPGPEMSIEELDPNDQDYRGDVDHNQRPSNIIMLRMLPPSATSNEVILFEH